AGIVWAITVGAKNGTPATASEKSTAAGSRRPARPPSGATAGKCLHHLCHSLELLLLIFVENFVQLAVCFFLKTGQLILLIGCKLQLVLNRSRHDSANFRRAARASGTSGTKRPGILLQLLQLLALFLAEHCFKFG